MYHLEGGVTAEAGSHHLARTGWVGYGGHGAAVVGSHFKVF